MAFVVGVSISSLVVVLSALLCPGGRVATGSPPLPSRPSWLVWSSPWPPSGSVLVVAGAILGWHGQESGDKYILKFSAASTLHYSPFPQIILLPSWCQIILQPPQITFTFSTNHLAANIIQHRPSAPDYGMPPWDLLPPSAGPLRRGHFVLVFPPKSLPSLVYFPGIMH